MSGCCGARQQVWSRQRVALRCLTGVGGVMGGGCHCWRRWQVLTGPLPLSAVLAVHGELSALAVAVAVLSAALSVVVTAVGGVVGSCYRCRRHRRWSLLLSASLLQLSALLAAVSGRSLVALAAWSCCVCHWRCRCARGCRGRKQQEKKKGGGEKTKKKKRNPSPVAIALSTGC